MNQLLKKLLNKREDYYQKYDELPDLFFVNPLEDEKLWENIIFACYMHQYGASRSLVDGSFYIFNCLIITYRGAFHGNMFAEKVDLKRFNEITPGEDIVPRYERIIKFKSTIFSRDYSEPFDARSTFNELSIEIPTLLIAAYQREMKRLSE